MSATDPADQPTGTTSGNTLGHPLSIGGCKTAARSDRGIRNHRSEIHRRQCITENPATGPDHPTIHHSI